MRRILSRLRHRPRQEGVRTLLWAKALQYRLLSDHQHVFTDASTNGAVLAIGNGTISVRGATLGYWPSPGALDGYVHLEARTPASRIEIGPGSALNNRCTLISEGPGIRIGSDVLIGPETMIFDSDFHHLDALKRSSSPAEMAPVHIGDRVFIGARAVILKGVTIGDNAVIGAGAVVTRDVDAGETAVGNPARIITSTTHRDRPSEAAATSDLGDGVPHVSTSRPGLLQAPPE